MKLPPYATIDSARIEYKGPRQMSASLIIVWGDTWRDRLRVRLILWLAGFRETPSQGSSE